MTNVENIPTTRAENEAVTGWRVSQTQLSESRAKNEVLMAALGEAVEWLRHLVPEQMADTKPGSAYRINCALRGQDPYLTAVASFAENARALGYK